MGKNTDFDLPEDMEQSVARIMADDYRPSLTPRSPSEALEPARAPDPPNRRRRRVHPILMIANGMMTLLVIGMLFLGGLFYVGKLQFDKAGPLDHSAVVVIPKGEGVNAIASRLEREGIISDRRVFVASVIYFKAQDKLKAGEYQIARGSSMRQVLDTIVEGRAILHKVTIPEGLTSAQVVKRLKADTMLQGDITDVPAEGSLLPDTYRFTRGTTRQDLVERMQSEQRKFMAKLWAEQKPPLPLKTREEVLILASIVEKETGRADERAHVASVFLNRLKRNMRLQSDPTIIYGLAGGKGTLDRPIQRDEITKPTPYNTYVISGLPPTPIANPGRAAIEATLKPTETKDLYFVADGTGGHVFAETLEQHNKNVANWRKIEREIRARQEAAARAEAEAQAAGAAAEGGTPQTVAEGTPTPATAPPASGLTVATAVNAAPAPNAAAAATGPAVPLPARNPRPR